MLDKPKRKTVDEMIAYANKLEEIVIKSTLKRKKNWYGKTKYVEYRLINGDIRSEILSDEKSIYFSRDEEHYFVIHYDKNGNFDHITEGFITGAERSFYNPYYFEGKNPQYDQGTHLAFFENGQLWVDKYFEPAGSLSGYYRAYHPNGKIAVIGEYINKREPWSHSPDGEWIWYYENGNLGKKINFKNGFCVGDLVLYDKDSNVIESKTYKEEDEIGVEDIINYFSVTPGPFVSNFRYRQSGY